MKISTKTGDMGNTKLVFCREVSKASQRVCAYGALDDFSATLGLARSFAPIQLAKFILNIQEKLVFLMTELATDNADYHLLNEKQFRLLSDDDLKEIEKMIEDFESRGETFAGWKHSGETHLQAALDMSRARCRNAEREIVKLAQTEPLPRDFALKYINRLSDLLYLLSQYEGNKKS